MLHVLFAASNLLPALLLATVQLGAMSGLVTAAVIKKLDNIVKIYSQSLTGKCLKSDIMSMRDMLIAVLSY